MNKPRTISRGLFWFLCGSLYSYLFIIEFATIQIISYKLNIGKNAELFLVTSANLTTILGSQIAVDLILRRYGLSRSGTIREVQSRSSLLPEGYVGKDEILCLYFDRRVSFVFVAISVFVFLALFVGLIIIANLTTVSVDWPLVGSLTGISLFIGGIFGWALIKPCARADTEGIHAFGLGTTRIMPTFIPWSEVATCEITTHFDTFGEPVISRPTLFDKHGNTLLRMDLTGITRFDQERLLKYIKAKLPKSKPDDWDEEGLC